MIAPRMPAVSGRDPSPGEDVAQRPEGGSVSSPGEDVAQRPAPGPADSLQRPAADQAAVAAVARGRRYQIVFSFVMGTMMVFLMTFVVTAANVGFPEDFLARWARAFVLAYGVAIPLIYFLSPVARRITARLTGSE